MPRELTRLAWLSVAGAVVVLFGVWPLDGGDLLIHLTVGRWIWQHGAIPRVDDFSYTTAGQDFLAHSWLSELTFYLIEQTAGTAASFATLATMRARLGLSSVNRVRCRSQVVG
jgi:hypothetical protein